MARRILVAIVFTFCATNAALAIECLPLPDVAIRGVWSLQMVDGKFCWYLGDSSIPKEQLRWPGSEPAQPRKRTALPAGQKIQCHKQVDKSKGDRWSWRLVDNRQCWFVGGGDIPRERLHWPAREQAELRKQFGESPEVELRKLFDELLEQRESPKDVKTIPRFTGQPAEAAPDSVPGWQIVNQGSGGDLEFIARDAWMAFMSIDLNIGAEYLTDAPMTYWPLLAERTPRPDRLAKVVKEPGNHPGY